MNAEVLVLYQAGIPLLSLAFPLLPPLPPFMGSLCVFGLQNG